MRCAKCGSFAINHRLHGRDGSDPDLCDVCFWRKRAELYLAEKKVLEAVLVSYQNFNSELECKGGSR